MPNKAPRIRKPESLLKPDIAVRYFETHKEALFDNPDLRITHVTPWQLRARNFVCFFDVVAREPKTWKRAVGLADKGNARVKEFDRLNALLAQDLPEQTFAIPKPLFLDEQLRMMFITHVPGETLADVVRHNHSIPTPVVRNVARWMKHLQSIHPDAIPHLSPLPEIDWAEKDVLETKKAAPEFSGRLTKAWKTWKKRWDKEIGGMELVLAHGDFHPYNIKRLPHANRVAVIDFGLLCKAPKFWDLASMLVQIDAIHGRYLPEAKVKTLRRGMLSAWEKEMGTLSRKDKDELAWLEQFFRISTVSYLLTRDPYPHIKRLYDAVIS